MLEADLKGVTYLQEIAEIQKELEDKKALLSVRDTSIQVLHQNIEKLLRKCIDAGVIKSWYYNGEYYWEE